MPSPITLAHIEAERRLRAAVTQRVTQIWNGLPGHDRVNLDQWLSEVVPLVGTAQRSSVSLTHAYLTQALGRPLSGVNPDELIGAAARNGAAPEEVYTRPFISLWSELGDGTIWTNAAKAALDRATGMAATDVQLSMRDTLKAVGETESFYGYQRVADGGACNFCLEVDGAYLTSSDAMPLHSGCGCSVEPLEEAHRGAVKLPDGTVVRDYAYGPLNPTPLPSGVTINQHGELGPVLGDPNQHFMDESEALAR